jgi:hypothetical protein
MRCGAHDAAECLNDHIRPHLRLAKVNDAGTSIRALAPCHADREPSLSVSVGGNGRVIWNCFAGCTQEATRRGLIRSKVAPACLVRSADAERDAEQEIRDILFGDLSAHHKVLALAAMSEGYDELPRGDALVDLAARAGVSRREAFRARSALQPVTEYRTP